LNVVVFCRFGAKKKPQQRNSEPTPPRGKLLVGALRIGLGRGTLPL
jgi:hypothetical protein